MRDEFIRLFLFQLRLQYFTSSSLLDSLRSLDWCSTSFCLHWIPINRNGKEMKVSWVEIQELGSAQCRIRIRMLNPRSSGSTSKKKRTIRIGQESWRNTLKKVGYIARGLDNWIVEECWVINFKFIRLWQEGSWRNQPDFLLIWRGKSIRWSSLPIGSY